MNAHSVFKSAEGRDAIHAVYDSLLEKWPIPYEKMTVQTRHGDTFVIACGDPAMPPLVLLHGSSSHSAMWIGDITAYAAHYRVYAIDLPGEPGRSTDIRPDLTTSAYAEWMEDTLRALGVKKASFVGISLGGWAVLRYATAHPEGVERLALLCPTGIGPQKATLLLRILPLKLLGARGERETVKTVIGVRDLPEETVSYSLLISKSYSPYMGAVPIVSDRDLRRITCPVLLIVGAKDAMIHSKKSAERLRRIRPDARITVLPEAGHGLLDQKDNVIAFLTGR